MADSARSRRHVDYPRAFCWWQDRYYGRVFPFECPDCGQTVPLKYRVTQKNRTCPGCGFSITERAIDAQLRNMEPERQRILEESRPRFGCTSLLLTIGIGSTILFCCGGGALFLMRDNHTQPRSAETKSTTATTSQATSDPPPHKQADKAVVGTLVLQNRVPVGQGVTAWVEIDGKRLTDWAVGTTEITVDQPTGKYRITVKMIYLGKQKTVFDKNVEFEDGKRQTIIVG